MQLSILISTYNENCFQLVSALQRQCEQAAVAYEILVGDDHSRDQVSLIANRKISELPHCTFIDSDVNRGQARNRNILAERAQGEWLLFIDSDAKVFTSDFVARYVDAMGKADVVVGGLLTPELTPEQLDSHCITAALGAQPRPFRVRRTLRYKYERNADKTRSAHYRTMHPFDKFTAFNAMVRRTTFVSVRFDEDCHQYGYEDTLFGYDLQRAGATMFHIDNPLLHMGIDTNEEFLRKTETSLHTLLALEEKTNGCSRLEQTAQKCGRYHLAWLVRLCFKASKPLLRSNLLGRNPSLFLFSFYKLGFFLCLKAEKA